MTYDIDGTEQEIFDRVVLHLAQQKRAAITDAGTCFYRYNGLKCAAGCLIPDEKYSPDIEQHNFDMLLDTFWSNNTYQMVDPVFTCNPALVDLISELQIAHDCSIRGSGDHKESLRALLHDVAHSHLLDPASISQITEWSR